MTGNISQQEASLDGQIEWTNAPVHLKDFQEHYGVPNLAKVVKGQYRDVGVAKSVQSELYVHAVETSQKVLAEGVKVKEGKKVVVSANQKYSLPLSYQGWFELLSQDGKAVKAITSVQELTRAFPAACIVRENIKVFIPRETGELALDKFRTLVGGEQIKLAGEIWVTANTNKGLVKRRLLQCMDNKGDNVYLGMEQKGLFSPIAGQTNISGVHSLRGLLDKFRFPILVRLVHGIIPSKLEKNFTGVFRLNGVYSEESVFVCPLKKDAKMVPISTREPLKLVGAENFEDVMVSDGYQYHADRCQRMIASYMNSIHLLFTMPDPNSVKAKKEEIDPLVKSRRSSEKPAPAGSEEDILFEEVEDIYAYVREGGPAPPPPRPRPARDMPPSRDVSVRDVPPVQPPPKTSVQVSSSKQSEEMLPSNKRDSPVTTPAPKVDVPDTPLAHADQPVTQSDHPRDSPRMDPHHLPRDSRHRIHHHHKHRTPSVTQIFTPTKDDFWEEPIYEPLDKIRRHKSTKKVEERIPAPVVIPQEEVPIVIPSPPAVATQAPLDRSASLQRRDAEVQNLRQVYKFSHENIHSPPPLPSLNDDDIDELKEMLDDINAPPVPPKKFADPETGVDPEPDYMFDNPSIDKPFDRSHGASLEQLHSDSSFDKPTIEDKAQFEASGETVMTFEDEPEDIIPQSSDSPKSAASPVPGHQSPIPATTATATILQSDIPVSPEPTVIVHTPTVTEHSRNFTHLHQQVPPPVSHHMQSQAPPTSSTSPTFVYKTTLSPPTSTTVSTQNGFATTGKPGEHIQKVHLNRPKDYHDVHILNRRTNPSDVRVVTSNGSSKPLGAGAVGPGSPYPHNRTSMARATGGGGGIPYSNDAPYVAVARVGDGVGAAGMRSDPRPFSSRQRKMQSMYL